MSEFHIHADLQEPAPELEAFLATLGLCADPFLACEGAVTHEPRYHYTLKTSDAAEFKKSWTNITQHLDEAKPVWRGYFETEAVFGGKTTIPDKPFDEAVGIPFVIISQSVRPGNFRRNELHIYFDDKQTDARIKEIMLGVGFFPAWCEYPAGGVEGIWTIQSMTINAIVAIRPMITQFLTDVGGVINCCIDEERVVDYRLSHSDVTLPPVIERINWAR